ncbi:MAG: hypothetical protein AMXMBFR34_23380 [Myxococcaceae bacterium]
MNPSQLTLSRRSRPPVAEVAAVIGMVAAAAWFVAVRQVAHAAAVEQQEAAVYRGAELISLLRRLAQERATQQALLLSEDTRLKAALAVPEVDRLTLLDLLQDIRRLDEKQVLGVLSPTGRVRAVLGAPALEGMDLGTSAAVKSALASAGPSQGAWLLDERVLEVGVAAVRVDEVPVGLVLTGAQLSDDELHLAAQGAGVQVALVLGGHPAWRSAPLPDEAWASPRTRQVEVNESAHYVVAATPRTPEHLMVFAWAVPIGVLLFATLAFWRGGGS